jgi:hypothetical protein
VLRSQEEATELEKSRVAAREHKRRSRAEQTTVHEETRNAKRRREYHEQAQQDRDVHNTNRRNAAQVAQVAQAALDPEEKQSKLRTKARRARGDSGEVVTESAELDADKIRALDRKALTRQFEEYLEERCCLVCDELVRSKQSRLYDLAQATRLVNEHLRPLAHSHSFAITVYKLQGISLDSIVLANLYEVPREIEPHLAYVALLRSKDGLFLLCVPLPPTRMLASISDQVSTFCVLSRAFEDKTTVTIRIAKRLADQLPDDTPAAQRQRTAL